MISYSGLLQKLNEKGMTKTALAGELGISSRTIAKIDRGEKIADNVLGKIAAYFGCSSASLCQSVSENRLLQALKEEKNDHMPGGLYHELQVLMAYNSNRIEGGRLTEEQTRLLFDTSTVVGGDGIPVDDIIETVNHFRAVDFCIDLAERPLSEEIIKVLHRILKQSTKDASLSWFAIGEYKTRPNIVGGIETAKPKDVPERMNALLTEYNAKAEVTIDDIIAFHYEFERIHPFQDGSGRVGRLVVLKECLRHNIVPFIIENSKKMYYFRGFSEWKLDNGYLTDVCLDGQDTFRKLMSMFDISE